MPAQKREIWKELRRPSLSEETGEQRLLAAMQTSPPSAASTQYVFRYLMAAMSSRRSEAR